MSTHKDQMRFFRFCEDRGLKGYVRYRDGGWVCGVVLDIKTDNPRMMSVYRIRDIAETDALIAENSSLYNPHFGAGTAFEEAILTLERKAVTEGLMKFLDPKEKK